MIDPITAIAGATAAFNTIKKGFAVGRDIESMAGDLGRWMGAVSDLKKADELNKKPPRLKKLLPPVPLKKKQCRSSWQRKKQKICVKN